ncbi:MAG: nickel-responsive transcriptional regulator NikR [Desulfurococcaceae archaeon]
MNDCRFGVYLPGDLCKELYSLISGEMGRARSKIMQEALRLYLVENKWRNVNGQVIGSINVLYDHGVGDVDERLTDIQHKFLNTIVSSLHIHIDANTCLQIIVVRGNSSDVRRLVEEFEKTRGVILVRTMIISMSGCPGSTKM